MKHGSRKPTSGAKKARWTTAQKREAKRAAARRPHQERSKTSRTERSQASKKDRWEPRGGPSRRDDRGGERRSNERRSHERQGNERRSHERQGNERRSDQRRSTHDRRPQQREARPTGERRDDRRDRRQDTREDRRPAPQQVSRPTATQPAAIPDEGGFAALGIPDVLVERMARDGVVTPFPIQAATVPDALEGRDVLGRGRTGSGKTLAFGLPLLTRLAGGGRARPHQPRALVLVPTRELAMQVSDALAPLAHAIGLRHRLVAGGMPYEPQLSALERGVDLLIATPGRMIDLIERGAADLSRIEVAVLDEADHMAQMGFLEAIEQILDLVPPGGQRLLFSATLDRGIDTVVERYLSDPVEHATDDGTASVTTMAHHALLIEPKDKKVVTAHIAARQGRTVVFVRTKLGCDRVAGELRERGVLAAALHGGLNQGQRGRVLEAFKQGTVPVLVATDVAARGIHVDDVGVVLQVDPPADHKDYLHRAGRTARAGEQGAVVTLALPHQRRMMQRLLDEAGVDTDLVRARPGDDVIRQIGGHEPEGGPISEQDLQALVSPPRRRGNGRPPRRGAGGPRGRGGPPRGGDRSRPRGPGGSHRGQGGPRRSADRPRQRD